MKVMYKIHDSGEYVTVIQPLPGECKCWVPSIKCSNKSHINEQCLGSHQGMCVVGGLKYNLMTKIKIVNNNESPLLFPVIF